MSLAGYYAANRFGLSFELFPPKTPEGETALYQHVARLVQFRPDYITCTYGAGGSTRDKTLEITSQVKRRFAVPVASHLTVVGSTVDQLREYLTLARERQVDYIVALRGDPPRGESSFQPVSGGFRYANELVELIRREFPQFGIAVAAYPETHQEATCPEDDLANLLRKVRAGADVVITQLFYNNDDFYRLRDRYRAAGGEAPLTPGILPVTNLSQIQRITSLCKARLPESFISKLAESEDPKWQFEVGVEFAIRQVQDLMDHGACGVHFYVLNKSDATCAVLSAVLGERAV